ncbi:MAG: hypothetical protein WA581_09500 [Candidatus Acidiferrales bacterium]
MTSPHRTQPKLPLWIRWVAALWLVFWFAVYWRSWGPLNFLHLCDIAEILACIGFSADNALLISSQAVASPLVDIAWALDAGWTFVFGHHLIGGTEYLFDPSHALWVRLLSLFHLVLPVLLLWAVHRLGYDRRGFPLQLGIAFVAFVASRFAPAAQNINYAFTDPFFHRSWGPAPVHIVVIFLFMLVVPYLPTHLVLKRLFRPAVSEDPGNI